jgi:hypothetical protein
VICTADGTNAKEVAAADGVPRFRRVKARRQGRWQGHARGDGTNAKEVTPLTAFGDFVE